MTTSKPERRYRYSRPTDQPPLSWVFAARYGDSDQPGTVTQRARTASACGVISRGAAAFAGTSGSAFFSGKTGSPQAVLTVTRQLRRTVATYRISISLSGRRCTYVHIDLRATIRKILA